MASTTRTRRLLYYLDQAGEWRWTHFAGNGKVTADSAEGYHRLTGARRGARATRMDPTGLRVVVDRNGELEELDAP